MPLPIEDTVAELINYDEPLLNSRLANLSNLNPEELGFLRETWASIKTKRRQQIVHQLVKLAEDSLELNFDCIFKDCMKDEDAEVRSKAIEGLWENDEPQLIDLLIELLRKDGSDKVQAVAATALGKFAMLAELEILRSCYKSKIATALLTVIDDKSTPIEVRRCALEATAPLSLPQVKEAILEAYQSANSELNISAINAMGKNCHHSWLPILIKELGNNNPAIRYEATEACGELGDEETVSYLIELINDPDVDIQLAVIQALSKVGGADAKECLKQCYNNPNQAIQQVTKQALHKLKATEDTLSYGI